MSDVSSKSPARPDLEAARLGMKVQPGAPPVGGADDVPEGTHFDKEGPTGPPNPKVRKIPPHLSKIIRFFQGLIADEGVLLDMCFDHCMDIVTENVTNRSAGIDHFAGDTAGGVNSFTPGHYAAVAAPMACELYRSVIKAVEGREEEYQQLVAEAKDGREKTAGTGRPGIIIPG